MSEIEIKDVAVIISGAIAAVSTLCAVAITSYFNSRSTKLTFLNQEKFKKLEVKLERLEELYVSFEKWEKNLSTTYLCFIPYYKNELSLDETRKIVSESNKSKNNLITT